ncbi:MAG: sulfotransferase domain-containing protein, partial [Acidimicrobiia bacterium]
WHLSDAWARRNDPNVVLVHYDDLVSDLDGEMRRIASRLGIEVDEATWRDLVDAAGFTSMRAAAERVAPDPEGILLDRRGFFRRGSSGAHRDVLTAAEIDRYLGRARTLAPPDFLAWLHRER